MRFTLAISAVLLLSVCHGVDAGHKRKQEKIKTLCPAAEVACPILGSTTYTDALKHHTSTKGEVSGVMAGAGGYECVDTSSALDSCGGCSSVGEGVDCSKIRGSSGVGCSEGKCVVFSCQPGWKPSLKAEKCVRARPVHSSSSKKHSGNHAAARIAFETKKTTSRDIVPDSSS